MMIIVTLKYVTIVMRADNKGEGGSLALLALINRQIGGKKKWTSGIILMGVFATALFYGDSMITPAISVLSAVEGLTTVNAGLEPFVVPIAVGILVGLFAIQSHGTARVGLMFGPVMIIYFVTLATLGVMHIVNFPTVILATINPLNAFFFFAIEPVRARREWRFEFPEPVKLPERLLDAEDLALGYGERRVLDGVHFAVRSGDRIGVLGVNGAGKSTLAKAIAAELAALAGELRRGPGLAIGYFAQHQLDQLRADESPLAHLRRLAPDAREQVLRDFAEMEPEKFLNVTNGVTPRRFVALSNPRLAALITRAIGGGWITDLDQLRGLEPFAEDAAFRAEWRDVKRAAKQELAHEPDALKIDGGLPALRPDQLKRGVIG